MANAGGDGVLGMGDGPAAHRPRAVARSFLKPDVLRPSEYKREMCMTTAERHRAFSDVRELDRLYAGHRPYKAFTVIPHRIVFQQFGRCDTQEQQVIFRNDDCIPHLLRVMPSMSPYISVTLVSAQGGKLAPGMFVAYRITFRPEEQTDYYYELQCTSDQVTFSVPVEAIGPRAILDFPDRIVFQNQPVQAEATKLLSVKNVGQKAAKFSLDVPRPFFVEPRCGTLGVDDVAQISVRFLPRSVGKHSQHAVLTYDNGEKVVVELHGCGAEVDIGLTGYTVRMDSTFIGLVSRKTVRLYNRSSTPATFEWRSHETPPPPQMQRGNSSLELATRGHQAPVRDPSLVPSLTAGARVRLPPTTGRPDANALKEPTFQHPIFSIEPLQGEVWPDSSVEVTAVFQPDSEGEASCVAYCQVTGRASRLPLHLSGCGRGADVQLSLDSLHIGAVFKNSVFNYEVVAVNHGDITATLRPLSGTSPWSKHISFSPLEMELHPKDHRTLVLTLDAQILGQLDETFSIKVGGASEPLTLALSGRVVPPTLEFDSPLLDFGVVPFGFRKVLRCRLKNTSLVPVEFSLSVPDDGEEPAIRQERLAAHLYQVVKKGLNIHPKEFTLRPKKGVLQAQSSISLKVELVANAARQLATKLRVDIDGVREALYSVPVAAECAAPDVQLRAPDIILGRHFKGRSTTGAITLVNSSVVPARFFVLPQQSLEFPGVTYTCEEPTGVIEPRSTATVPFTVQLQALGSLAVPIRLVVFGRPEPLVVMVRVVSQGPVIDIQPPSLDWGVIPVLTPQQKTVTISNQAPVPAVVSAAMQRSGNYWTIDPATATIGPERSLSVKLSAVLDDPLRFLDVLVISVQDSGTWEIPVAAQGRGSSILFEPPLRPVVELGPVFCKSPLTRVFAATNKGRRYHQLVWSNDGVVDQSVTSLSNQRSSSVKLGHRMPGQVPVFRITPRRVDVYPGETHSFTLEAYCESVGRKREEMSCTAMIGNSSGKNVLKRMVVTAEFISPDIEFSHRELRFQRKQLPGVECTEHMSQTLTLTNNSPLALTTHIRTQYPFLLRNLSGALSAELDYELGVHRCMSLDVLFDPDYEIGLTSRYVRDKLTITYEEHPHCDEITLIGIVSFPNLTISDSSVEFGCILNDMESFRKIKITNCSKVPVLYHWYFVDSETELDWLPDTEDEGQEEEEKSEPEVPTETILRETKVDQLIRGPIDDVPVECALATIEEVQLSLRQRRQSRYVQPVPPLDRLTAAEKLEKLWKKQSKVNEILDIYPLRGKLQPGDNTSVVFKFYGHGSVRFATRAVCVVNGGPQYSVRVTGRASSIRYRLEENHVECGGHIYCQFLETSTVLVNSGQVEFSWKLEYEPEEGRLQVAPTEGVLAAGAEQPITIHFLPMIPEHFERTMVLSVAHFPPEVITVSGHGAYPAVMLDLPLHYQDISDLIFLQAVQNIDAVMQMDRQQSSLENILSPCASEEERVLAVEGAVASGSLQRAPPSAPPAPPTAPIEGTPPLVESGESRKAEEGVQSDLGSAATEEQSTSPPEVILDAEEPAARGSSVVTAVPEATPVEESVPNTGEVRFRLLPSSEESGEAETEQQEEGEEEEEETAVEEQEPTTPPLSPSWSVISNSDSAIVDAALIDLEVERLVTSEFIKSHPTTASFLRGDSGRRNAVSLDLLKYHLDFGLVLLGSDLHRAITVTNISQLPVNLSLLHTSYDEGDEFSVTLQGPFDCLEPGDSTYINVRFRPTSLEGAVETVQRMIHLEVRYGLFIPILIKATVTMPIAEMDRGELSFGTVYLGMCKMCQLKVHNNGILPAQWSLTARLPDRPAALPFSAERQRRQQANLSNAAPIFSFQPCQGTLEPDHWQMVDVVFTPARSRSYVMEAVLSVQGSTDTWIKRMTGEGLDSVLDVSLTELTFEPIVPYMGGGQMQIMVFNRHPIPLEIYSLEYDRQYMEEEHVLRQLPGYDEWGLLMLPPRSSAEPLPAEVRSYYTELVHRASAPGKPPTDPALLAPSATGAVRESHASLDGASRRTHSRMLTQSVSRASPTSRPSATPKTPRPRPPTASPEPGVASGHNSGESGAGSNSHSLSSSPESHPAILPQVAVTPDSSEDVSIWPGWTGVVDQTGMWNLPAQEQFIKDFLESGAAALAGPPLGDPVSESLQGFISRDQPADLQLLLSRRAPAFVIINAPFTEPYLLAILLAERYGMAILTLDQLVWESVVSPTSPAAQHARDFLCDNSKAAGRTPAASNKPGGGKRGQGSGGRSNARKRSDSSSSASQNPAAPDLREVLKPRPLAPPILGDLIAARLMEPELEKGVVFWDIHNTQFSANVTHSIMALLLGLGKRKHAYFITLEKTMAQYKEASRKRDTSDENTNLNPEPGPLAEAELLLCDEEQYLELTDKDRRRLDMLLRRSRRQRAKERRDEVRRLQEQLRQEHEKKFRKGKGAPGLHKQISHHAKVSASGGSESRKPSVRKPSAISKGGSKGSLRRSDISVEAHDRKKRSPNKRKGEEETMDEKQIEEEKLIAAQFKVFGDSLSTLICLLDVVDRDRLTPEGLPTDDVLKFGSTAHKKSTKSRGQRTGKASTLSKRATNVDEFKVPTDLGVTHVLLNGSLDSNTCFRMLVDNGVLPTPEHVKDHMGLGAEGPPLGVCRQFSMVKYPPMRSLPEVSQPVFTFVMDEAEKASLAAEAAEKEERAQRSTPEKSPPPKRRGQRRKNQRRKSDASLADQRAAAGSVAGDVDADLASAIRQSLQRDEPVVSGHRWVVPPEGELMLTVQFDVNRPGRYSSRLQLEAAGSRRRYTLNCTGSCVLPLINRKIKTLYSKVPMRQDDNPDEHGVAFVRGTRTLAFGPLPVVKQSQRQWSRRGSATSAPIAPHGHLAEITMENVSPLPVEISFFLFNDSFKVLPFQIWPQTMQLDPGSKDYLQVMALPPSAQTFEDMLIGCVKDNPDPWITKVTCMGAKPEVHLDKKMLAFDRVLLLRQETRKLVLTNKSLIPLRFRVADTEQLGDEFKFSPKSGTLVPLGIYEIIVDFSPVRPCLFHNKKIKMEITEHVEVKDEETSGTAQGATNSENSASTSPRSPRNSSLGVLQAETVVVSGEGFDVAVDLLLPKGLTAGIDFGTVKVKEEAKQTFTIKNKGKYEIMFKAWLEDPEPPVKGVKPLTHGFHINPDRGILHPHERPLVVQMWYTTDTEREIKKAEMLRVQILDYHKKEEGEVIALIPVSVSVRALFCKYSVDPSNELNMGHFPPSVRKAGFFVIKNDGKFDFSYHIIRKNVDPPPGHVDSPKEKKKRTSGGKANSESGSKSSSQENGNVTSALSVVKASEKTSKTVQSMPRNASQDSKSVKLTAGIFNLQPAMGTIPVGSQTTVNVDALSNEPLRDTQELVIRISDAGDGVGIPFRLLGVVTAASIRAPDNSIVSIFEGHTVVDSLKDYDPTVKRLAAPPDGVYGTEDNRFMIRPTVVGDSAVVSFKVQNFSMIPVDIVIAIKPPGAATKDRGSKNTAETTKIFDISPTRSTIPVHGFTLVNVTFTPSGLQSFTNVVDVQIEESTGIDRSKGITFEVVGEGTLPRVDVLEPLEVNRQQEPVVEFRSTRLGDIATGTVRLKNVGVVETMVDLLMPEGRDVFTIEAADDTLEYTLKGQVDGQHGMISDHGYILGTLRMPPGVEAAFSVTFRPREVGAVTGALLVSVSYNDFLRPTVRLNGHGYCRGVIVRGLPSERYVPPPPPPPPTGKNQKDAVQEPQNVISMDMPQFRYGLEFTACYIGATYRRQFRMENCSDDSRYRFDWSNTQYLTFSPALGHLAPREIKTVTLTFTADEAINFEKVSHAPVDLPPERKRGKNKPEPVKQVPEHLVSCVITSIRYDDDPAPPADDGPPAAPLAQTSGEVAAGGSWDERSRSLQLVAKEPVGEEAASPTGGEAEEEPEMCTRLLPEPEPAYEELSPSPALRIDIQAVLQTDLPKVKFTQTEVIFDDTFMFQTRTEEVTLENVGQAEVQYSWILEYVPPPAPRVNSPCQVNSRDLGSQTSALESRQADSAASFLQLMSRCADDLVDYVPFTVQPAAGVIQPGETATIRLQFAPLDVLEFDALLRCSILYLPEDDLPPSVSLHGRGVLPVCHFDLENTSCQERDDLDAPTNCDLRVITIQAVGVNKKSSRSFRIINPTESSWHFTFAGLDTAETEAKDAWFNCVNLSGVVHAGQRAKVTFEFFPRCAGTFKSRWQFMVMEYVLAVELLLVGRAREPIVYAVQPNMVLPPVLRGLSSHGVLTLVNQEETACRYQLDLDSCFSANQALRLGVQPIEGTIPANGSADIGLQYAAQVDGQVEFGLRFRVDTCHDPLAIAVRAEGYTQFPEATLAVPGGRPRKLSSTNVNQLDLGLIPCRDMVYRTVDVVNTGAFPFCVEMEDATEARPPRTTITCEPASELVEPRQRITCKFGISCSTKIKFSNIKILIRVMHGPVFVLLVRGSAEPPTMLYSFLTQDFGPCFLHQEGMPPNLAELKVENKDKNPVSVGVQCEDVPYFKVDFKQAVVPPNEKAVIPITFVPSETRRYSQPLNVIVNGQVHKTIPLTGDGVRFQVEVAHPQYKKLVLGTFRAGQRLQRSVTVVNRADTGVKCKFQLTCQSPELQNLSAPVLRLRPAEADMKPHSSIVLELLCFSKTRLPWFQEEVRLTALDLVSTLLTVEGICQGMDVRLDVPSLPFGPVAAYSQISRNICIINDGDIGAKFRWSADPLLPEFSVHPMYGYSAPKSRVVCNITFQPKELASVVKKEGVTCDVENFGSLPLTLTGACVPVTAAKDPLQFQTSVRSEDVKTIQIPNKTNIPWEIVPVISGDYWKGPEAITIPAQGVGVYPVTYRPKMMTQPGAKHMGSVFLPLPDGQALLYSVTGIADPPQPEARITADICCKTTHRETVQVHNWLTEAQRFTCKAELVRGEKDKTDGSSVQLSGLDIMDVPALNTLPYTLTVYCFKEGNFHIKLTFRNDISEEMIFFDILYRASKSHERQQVVLNTVVRRAVAHSVLLERPLDSPMTCQVSCNMNELILGHHGTIHFPAGQEARVAFECLPLREGEVEAPMDVHSQEMGTYGFQIQVTARRPPIAGTVRFSCPLGQSVTKQVKFTNYSKTRAEYSTQLMSLDQLDEEHDISPSPESPSKRRGAANRDKDEDKPKSFAELLTQLQLKGDSKELVVDRAVFSPPGWPQGVESSFDLTFEPADICSIERGLVLGSPHGGEYRFEIYATCTLPEPQGPFTIKAGSNVVIPFKNIFPAAAPFLYYVDSPYFSIQKTPDTIRAKKDIRVTVSFDPNKGPDIDVSAARPVTGCLTISGPTLPHGHTPAWRYYLRGLPSDK